MDDFDENNMEEIDIPDDELEKMLEMMGKEEEGATPTPPARKAAPAPKKAPPPAEKAPKQEIVINMDDDDDEPIREEDIVLNESDFLALGIDPNDEEVQRLAKEKILDDPEPKKAPRQTMVIKNDVEDDEEAEEAEVVVETPPPTKPSKPASKKKKQPVVKSEEIQEEQGEENEDNDQILEELGNSVIGHQKVDNVISIQKEKRKELIVVKNKHCSGKLHKPKNYDELFEYFIGNFYNLLFVANDDIAQTYRERLYDIGPEVLKGPDNPELPSYNQKALPNPIPPFAKWKSFKKKKHITLPTIFDDNQINFSSFLKKQESQLQQLKTKYPEPYNSKVIDEAIKLTNESPHKLPVPPMLIDDMFYLQTSNVNPKVPEDQFRFKILTLKTNVSKGKIIVEFPGITSKIQRRVKDQDLYNPLLVPYRKVIEDEWTSNKGKVYFDESAQNIGEFSLSCFSQKGTESFEVQIPNCGSIEFEIQFRLPFSGEKIIREIHTYKISPLVFKKSLILELDSIKISPPPDLPKTRPVKQAPPPNARQSVPPAKTNATRKSAQPPPKARNETGSSLPENKLQNPLRQMAAANQRSFYIFTDDEKKSFWPHDAAGHIVDLTQEEIERLTKKKEKPPPELVKQKKDFEAITKKFEKDAQSGKVVIAKYKADLHAHSVLCAKIKSNESEPIERRQIYNELILIDQGELMEITENEMEQ